MEIFRFGHRDWYTQDFGAKRTHVEEEVNVPFKYTKPSVTFEDEYFNASLIQRIAWGCTLKLTAIHALAFAAFFHLHQLSWQSFLFREFSQFWL